MAREAGGCYEWAMRATTIVLVLAAPLASQAPLRWIDLDGDASRQVTVRQEPRRYLGHPTTLLLPDGATMLCVHPEGHGRGPIVLQRSEDAGQTWSEPLAVPESWATSKETPTIHRLIDPAGGAARLVLFSGLFPIRSSVSEDDGATWSELAPIGPADAPFGGIVAMSSVVRLAGGDYAAFFHDDGRFFRNGKKRAAFAVYQTRSSDGGMTWGAPTTIWSGSDLHLCEPGVIRSPDGGRLAMLLEGGVAGVVLSSRSGRVARGGRAQRREACGRRRRTAWSSGRDRRAANSRLPPPTVARLKQKIARRLATDPKSR